MNTRNLVNLILLLVVISLGSLVLFDPFEKEAPAPAHLSELSTENINHIEIMQDDKTTTILDQKDNKWFLIKPVTIAANEVQVFELLGLINTISYAHFDVAQANLAKYGLQPPHITLKFNEATFTFGERDPINHNRYIMYNNSVHLIRDFYTSIANSAPMGLVSLALFPEAKKITSLVLPHMHLNFVDGSWKIDPPPSDPVSQDAIHKLVDDWAFAQALEVSQINSKQLAKHKTNPIQIGFSDTTTPLDLLTYVTDNERLIVNLTLGIQYHLAKDNSVQLFEFSKPGSE